MSTLRLEWQTLSSQYIGATEFTLGIMPLDIAVQCNDTKITRMLLDAQSNTLAPNQCSASLLHLAINQGKAVIVQMLLDAGADVSRQKPIFGTALHAAAWKKDDEIIKILLEAGSDVLARNMF